MIVTLIPYCPRSEGRNLGLAYNELMNRLHDEDWACFIDHDACFTTVDWYAQLEEITAELREPCVLTAVTNRVGSRWQLAPEVDRENHSMAYHRRVGSAIQTAGRRRLRDVTQESLMSGVVILLSKDTWRRLGGFADGFLGVDNAIHQAARDHGFPVYLMEGVYVYHWYRADQGRQSESVEPDVLQTLPSSGDAVARATVPNLEGVSGSPSAGVADLDAANRAIWGHIHVTGHRVLLIGHNVGPLGRLLQGRKPTSISVIELDESVVDRSRDQLGEAVKSYEFGDKGAFQENSFDAILGFELLEHLSHPERLLRTLRRWLAPDGRLITTGRNVRSLPVIEALLGGHWAGAEVADPRRPIRFFTRRELEKLLFRAGFAAASFTVLPGPGHDQWVRAGRPGTLKLSRLNVGGLTPDEAEEFFTRGYLLEAAPGTDSDMGTTSIVLVTHNQIDYTRQCVESIRRLTDEPYELIFVDNASTDGTIEYLQSLPRTKRIFNQDNRGFPVAVNHGIGVAGGDQILLLNNDTVVTTAWLHRLLRALHADPRIGLVGPCSNCVSGGQQVETRYDDLSSLDGFAWEWGKSQDCVIEESTRLVGFCLLIRRAVVDQVGLLDERFGIGCFEDDDFCLRAIQAGWRAVIARDAFVHHYGGATFIGSGANFAAIMRENEQRFRQKWQGAKRTAPVTQELGRSVSEHPGPGPFAVVMVPGGGLRLQRKNIRLSLCMIVRDSARTLPACLESIYPWVDEMVIVDTGSMDETPRIVESFGGRLFHFPWCDDFSAARNESLKPARGEWVFWMDSDDTIDPDCGRKLRELAYRDVDPSVLGVVVQVHCPGGGADGSNDITAVDHVKLFRNRPDLRFDGRIHEQILPAIRRAGGEVAWTDLFVIHSGSDQSAEAQERKRQRDLRILHKEFRERPEHPFTLFNLGMTYADGEQYEEAADFLKRSIAHSGVDESQLRKAYALLVYAQMQLKRGDEARATCRRARELFPDDAELRFRQGVLLHDLGCLEEAARAYHDVLDNREERHFSSVNWGIFGFRARQNLAVVYTAMGNAAAAEAQWRLVVEEMPGYRAGWRGLGESLLRQGKFAEIQVVIERLRGDKSLIAEACLLSGRLGLARGDVHEARTAFERAVIECPEDSEPRHALCQLLFERGTPEEAERALKDLIARDPTDASSHHNLGTLYLKTRRYREAVTAYQASIRHRPEAAATHLHLGYALKESGHLREAVSSWKQVLRLAPGDPAAEEELRKAEGRGVLVGGGRV